MKHRRGTRRHRTRKSLLFLAVIVICISFVQHAGGKITDGYLSLIKEFSDTHSENTVQSHMDVLAMFEMDDASWENLGKEEKLKLFQTVADIEADYFGIPYHLNVKVANLWGGELAIYCNNNHTITIDAFHFNHDSPYEILEATCHECFHAYQHCLVDVYNDVDPKYKELIYFEKAQVYRDEFDNYVEGNENLVVYFNQKCEEDARSYAEGAVYDYQNKIRQYEEGIPL